MRPATGLPILCLALALLAPAAAAGQSASAELADQVLDMLSAGLSDQVILAWLESGSGPLEPPSAEQLIALKEAGASDELLQALIPSPLGEPLAHPPGERPPSTPATAETSTDRPTEATAGGAEAIFELTYVPRDPDFEDRLWDLLVYLDGMPLSYVPASTLLTGDAVRFRRPLEAGTHVIRVALERHRRRGERWSHEAYFAGDSFRFEIAGDSPAEVTVAFQEAWLGGTGGPLSFHAAQGDRVTELKEVGGDPDRWPALCDDVQASAEESGKTGRALERRLDGCVSWSEIWEGREVPSRREVLEALARFDFKPVPKGG